MRALLGIVLAVAALWAGYWWVGSSAVERGAVDWFAAQEAQGITARNGGIAVQGFPNRFDLTVTDPDLADPAQGIGWSAPFVQVFAMTWKPWHLIAALPNTQTLTLPDQAVTVDSSRMMASLLMHPDTAMGLNETRFEAADLALASDQGWSLTVAQVNASTLEDATKANTHRLGLSVKGIVLGDGLAKAVAAADLPAQLDSIHLDAHASLTAPLDRHAGETHPALTGLDLADASLNWGALKLTAKGTLTADEAGFAQGEIAIRVEGWRRLPPLLVAVGAIKPQLAPTIARALEVMAQGGTDPQILDVVLKCAQGRMVLGPLPLGPAPRLH
jgi:hypothetical protein